MDRDGKSPRKYMVSQHGLALSDLPPPGTMRWVPRRKATIVAAVHGGLLSLDEACARYALTVEEFLSWDRALGEFGIDGLRMASVQQHRHDAHH